MIRLPCLSFLASVILSSSLLGEVFILDFEESGKCAAELVSSGMRITNARGTICFRSSGSNSVSNGTVYSSDTEGLRIVNVEGDTFTPVSIDLAEYSISVGAPNPIQFLGRKLSGEKVDYEVILDGVADGSGGADDFQTFAFPPEFEDLISLESPTRLWSVDNIVIDSIPPPELPTNQRLEASYLEAEFLRSQQALWHRNLVIGPDFHYTTGSFSPETVIFLSPNGVSFSAIAPYYDPPSDSVVYKSGADLYRRDREGFESLETLAAVIANGFAVSSIGRPILYGDRLIFEGYNFSGNDAYYILERSDGVLTQLVGPTTLLPAGDGESKSLPSHFPDFRVIGDQSYAFETSLEGSSSITRVFVKWLASDFQLVISEGDSTEFGAVFSVTGLSFDRDNILMVNVVTSDGSATFRYDSNGLLGGVMRSVVATPIDAGVTASGVTELSVFGTHFLNSNGVQYREQGGNFYKVLGSGDSLGVDTISDLRFLGISDNQPERVILDIALEGASQRTHYIVTLAEPVDALPQIGKPLIYNKNGKLYLPVSHLTAGLTYSLEASPNLEDWQIERNISDIQPLQYLIMDLPLPNPAMFYRIVEQ